MGQGGSPRMVPRQPRAAVLRNDLGCLDRKSTRLNSSHANISYAVFCLKNTMALRSPGAQGEHGDAAIRNNVPRTPPRTTTAPIPPITPHEAMTFPRTASQDRL